ncbi:MAG: 3-hydroxyacyl-ACP dehydratase FabZ [Clostridiales bacterium]|nr:3-hydroxyacyl-ACP dehydratase FabZ [Clostridiales bacterium]
MGLTLEQIKEIIPHREPFLMIDRVEEYAPGDYAIARKAVSANEWFFQGHFKDYKVMPGVLQIEAMAQVGAIALLSCEEHKGKLAFFGGIKKARFRRKVLPGDMLIIHGKVTGVKGNIGFGEGKILVDDKVVASCELTFALQDPKDV